MSTSPPSALLAIYRTWWPLASSWLLMGLELPLVAAIISRLPDPEVHLAAYGGIVFPISLVIEAPVIMILVASTALCKNWPAYQLVRNCILMLGASLTCLHIGVAFTPLYGIVVEDILGAPAVIVEPGRTGLQLMTLWTMAIAIRRFYQGLVIRSGQTRLIGLGTLVRLCVSSAVLFAGYAWGQYSGIVAATLGVSSGVIVEAGFILYFVRPALRALRLQSGHSSETLTLSKLATFYGPLAMTPLITLLTLPIISGALSRMPLALESLAVWPVLGGLSFIFRSIGFSVQEVVVSFMDRPDYFLPLKRFVSLVSLGTCGGFVLIAVSPLSTFWFEVIAALTPSLSSLAQMGIWVAVLMPALSPWESFYQGILVHQGKTTRITQAVCLYLIGCSAVLVAGVFYGNLIGLLVGLLAMVMGVLLQIWWLRRNSATAEERVGFLRE